MNQPFQQLNLFVPEFIYGIRISKKLFIHFNNIISQHLLNKQIDISDINDFKNVFNKPKQIKEFLNFCTRNQMYKKHPVFFKQHFDFYNEIEPQLATLYTLLHYKNSQKDYIFSNILQHILYKPYTVVELVDVVYNIYSKNPINITKKDEIEKAIQTVLYLDEIFVYKNDQKIFVNKQLFKYIDIMIQNLELIKNGKDPFIEIKNINNGHMFEQIFVKSDEQFIHIGYDNGKMDILDNTNNKTHTLKFTIDGKAHGEHINQSINCFEDLDKYFLNRFHKSIDIIEPQYVIGEVLFGSKNNKYMNYESLLTYCLEDRQTIVSVTHNEFIQLPFKVDLNFEKLQYTIYLEVNNEKVILLTLGNDGRKDVSKFSIKISNLHKIPLNYYYHKKKLLTESIPVRR